MDPEAKRHVTIRLPIELHHVCIVKGALVAIRRREGDEHHLALTQPLAAELSVVLDHASDGHRCERPQELLARGRCELWVIAQPLLVLRVGREMQDGSGERAPRGVDPGQNEQDGGEHDLLVLEAIAIDLGFHQHADHVVTRIRTPLLDELVEEREHLQRSGARVLDVGRGLLEQALDPAAEAIELARTANEMTDDCCGNEPREVIREIERVPPGEPVEQLDHAPADLAREGAGARPGEGGREQLLRPCVLGRVEVERGTQKSPKPMSFGTLEYRDEKVSVSWISSRIAS